MEMDCQGICNLKKLKHWESLNYNNIGGVSNHALDRKEILENLRGLAEVYGVICQDLDELLSRSPAPAFVAILPLPCWCVQLCMQILEH